MCFLFCRARILRVSSTWASGRTDCPAVSRWMGSVEAGLCPRCCRPAAAKALEVLYVVGADPALRVADQKAAQAALGAAGFVVVQDSLP